MRERLETRFKGELTDTHVGIEQRLLGPLQTHAREVFAEFDTGRLLEQFAEIERAEVQRPRRLAKGKVRGAIGFDVSPGTRDERRFDAPRLDDGMVAHHGKVFGEDAKELQRGSVLFVGQRRRLRRPAFILRTRSGHPARRVLFSRSRCRNLVPDSPEHLQDAYELSAQREWDGRAAVTRFAC